MMFSFAEGETNGEKSCPGPINVWYIYLHGWLMFMVNVGKYTIPGCYGMVKVFRISPFLPPDFQQIL